MANAVDITSVSRYVHVVRADGSLVSRHLTVEDAIEAAVNAGHGAYRITYPDRLVKVYGTLPTTPAPAAPASLTLEEVTAGYAGLSWADDGTGTSWTVYRDGTPIGTATSAYYTDSTVVPSTLYSYQVQASNSSGSSVLSDALAVTTSANSLPEWSLTDLSGTIGTAFALDLSTVCDDSDGQSLAFTLTSGSVPGLSLASPNYTGTPTTAGAFALTFRVDDGYGTADVSITFNVYDPDVTAPTVPTNVSASVNGSTVTVSWTASTDATGVAMYKIYRNGVFRSTDAASPYIETGVPIGSYTYTVSAVDLSENANESAQSTGAPVTVAPATPDTPINFTATSDGATTINLSWAPGPNGTAPDDYDLDFSTTGTSGPWTAITFVGTATTYAHTGRTAGTTYYYRVRAGLGALESGYATATSSTGIRWNPGYYVQTSGAMDWPGTTDIDAVLDYASNSYITGINIRPYWRYLETARGTYNWDVVDYALDRLPTGKKLWMQLPWARFNTSGTYGNPPSGATLLPSYLLTSEFDGGVLREFKNYTGTLTNSTTGQWDIDTRIWNSAVRTRYLALISAFGERYQDDDRVAGLAISEMAFDSLKPAAVLAAGDSPNFNGQTFVDSICDVILPGVRQRIGSMDLMVYMNFLTDSSDFSGDKFVAVRDAAVSAQAVINGPDTDPAIGGKTGMKYARGALPSTLSLQRNCQGITGIGCGLQARDLDVGGSREFSVGWTGTQYAEWMYNTQRVSHVFSILHSKSKFTQLMAYAAANPNSIVRTARPSGYN